MNVVLALEIWCEYICIDAEEARSHDYNA